MNKTQKRIKAMVDGAADCLTTPAALAAHQVAVSVMCGGGFLGKMAAEQPADFYIDERVSRLPFPRRKIETAVAVLAGLAVRAGLNPHKMPRVADWHQVAS